mgnify:CR=1 FL=1
MKTELNKHKICLVVVDVRSAHNIGSMFRSCDGFGAELYLVGICPRPVHDDDNRLPYISKKSHKEISKTALGAEDTVKWRHADTLLECINNLRKENYKFIAIEQSPRSKSLKSLKIDQNTALVVGREVEGLSLVEIGLCDEIFEIPMIGAKESFNVAVSAGIALYQSSN